MTEIALVRHGSKPSGSVTTFLRKLAHGEKTGNVKVPCGQCNACCRSKYIHADLLPHELADFPEAVKVDMSASKRSSGWALPKKEDGSCVHLIEGKCSIYDRRPHSCRTYDCRLYLLTGAIPVYDEAMAEAIKQWAPLKLNTTEDKQFLLAARLAICDGGLPDDEHEAFNKLCNTRNYLTQASQLLKELDALPREQKSRLVSILEKGERNE